MLYMASGHHWIAQIWTISIIMERFIFVWFFVLQHSCRNYSMLLYYSLFKYSTTSPKMYINLEVPLCHWLSDLHTQIKKPSNIASCPPHLPSDATPLAVVHYWHEYPGACLKSSSEWKWTLIDPQITDRTATDPWAKSRKWDEKCVPLLKIQICPGLQIFHLPLIHSPPFFTLL